MNCWEYMECGREKGGINEKDDPCPAYPNHGTRCADIAGTLCGARVHGVFALKLLDCTKCEFYRSRHYEGNGRS